ncbi:MAG: M20 family metallopeptidase [Dehalococcoidia bacterium]|nr:M20 family metallopeptidase [Dehalococcoidia bacterium]
MTDWLFLAKSKESDLFELIEKLVLIETPTSDKPANDHISSIAADLLRSLGGDVKVHPQEDFGDHITADWPASAGGSDQHALIVGHLDTVWPLGTLERMGYYEEYGRMYGPGVLDMKAGIATTIIGLQTLKEQGLWPDRPIKILFNTDEEVGSPSSRPLVEESAKGAEYALIMEPGQAGAGALKTQRKGLGEFKIYIAGKASHAGAFPERGASAIHQLALTVIELQGLNDWPNGITINSGIVSGGSARNTIPAYAEITVDVRVQTLDQSELLEAKLRALKPSIEGTTLKIEGNFHRPPMVRTPELAELAGKLIRWSNEFGFELTEESTGGGSDANLTAAMGVPSADGLGSKGLNPHAEGENIQISEQVNRLALFMKAINSL